MGKKRKAPMIAAKTTGKKARTQTVSVGVGKVPDPDPVTAPTVKVAGEKAMLKLYVSADVVRRVRMTAADQGRQPGDLVDEILDGSLPHWRKP